MYRPEQRRIAGVGERRVLLEGVGRRDPVADRPDLARHGLVGIEDVKGHPTRHEAQQHRRDLVAVEPGGLSHALHFRNEVGMGLEMRPGMALVDAFVEHQRLFAGEVEARVAAQAIEDAIDGARAQALSGGNPIAQQVDQVDQAVVLLVDGFQAGLEVRRPFERLDRVTHAASTLQARI